MPSPTVRLIALLAVSLLLPVICDASPGARWRQGWNLSGQRALPSSAGNFADLKLQAGAGGQAAIVVRNLLAGPVQVRLRGLPTPQPTQLLAASEQRTLLRLPEHIASTRLLLDAVPGDPAAQATDHLYQLPFRTAQVRVSQAFGGTFSHRDAQNLHAVDFPLAEGTPVIAARAGQVMQLIEGSPELGSLIRILHDDGSMGLYAHLRSGGLLVRPGQRVEMGQALAASGNTGRSNGPHLHFAVQLNTGLALVSVPFRMSSDRGELKFPRQVP